MGMIWDGLFYAYSVEPRPREMTPFNYTCIFRISALRKTFVSTDWQNRAVFKTELMWISIKSHDFVSTQPNESPSILTPPPRYGPRPPPSAMFDHFPKYDEAASDSRQFADDDELHWDALLGIPQIGRESVVAASHSNEEITTTQVDQVSTFGTLGYGDITAGIVL